MRYSRNELKIKAKSVVYTIILHGLLIGAVVLSFKWSSDPVIKTSSNVTPVQATIVTDEQLQQELNKLKQKDVDKKKKEEEHKKTVDDLMKKEAELAKKREQREKELADIEEKKQIEEQKAKEAEEKAKQAEDQARVAEIKRQEELEKTRLAESKLKKELEEAKIAKEKLVKEQKRLEKLKADEKKRLADEERKRQEEKKKQLAEEKRKKEEARKKRLADEKRKKEQAEKKRIAAEKRKREESLRKELEAEQLQREAGVAMSRFESAIRQKVTRNWARPPSIQAGLSVLVTVTVTPTGDVISARVTRSSGNTIFDRSAERAVKKASPLPIPDDPRYYEYLRIFNFEFKPEAVVS